MSRNDIEPDRVTRARYAATDLLLAQHGARVGLVAFAGEAHAVAPLTTDVATIRTLLQPLSPQLMPETGDNLAPALLEAQRLLKAGYAPKGRVVVLSDGFADPAATFNEAGKLRESGLVVDVVGVGHQATQGSDELQRVAAAGGGVYVSLNDLPALVKRLESPQSVSFADASYETTQELTRWQNEGVWLLIPILVLGIVLSRRGWV
jgi:Ca-activated chloride channel family protein